MPVLTDSTRHAEHAVASDNWVIASNDPGPGVEVTAETEFDWVTVTYTDVDGNDTFKIFGTLLDATVYSNTIETFWQTIDLVNRADEDTKNTVYREILTLMKGQVGKYGQGYLPKELKSAVNEIETHFKLTIWD